jgi:hypothetical protein
VSEVRTHACTHTHARTRTHACARTCNTHTQAHALTNKWHTHTHTYSNTFTRFDTHKSALRTRMQTRTHAIRARVCTPAFLSPYPRPTCHNALLRVCVCASILCAAPFATSLSPSASPESECVRGDALHLQLRAHVLPDLQCKHFCRLSPNRRSGDQQF